MKTLIFVITLALTLLAVHKTTFASPLTYTTDTRISKQLKENVIPALSVKPTPSVQSVVNYDDKNETMINSISIKPTPSDKDIVATQTNIYIEKAGDADEREAEQIRQDEKSNAYMATEK